MLLKPGLENSCLDVLPNWRGYWGWVAGVRPGLLVIMLRLVMA